MMKRRFLNLIVLVFLLHIQGVSADKLDRLMTERPLPAPERWMQVIGRYEGKSGEFYLAERGGKLLYIGDKSVAHPIRETGGGKLEADKTLPFNSRFIKILRDSRGTVTGVRIGKDEFKRTIGSSDEGDVFRIQLVKSLEQLRKEAVRANPPVESGAFREPDLVELVKLDPSIKLDIRYAGVDNFMGAPFYSQSRAFLQRDAAEALVRVSSRVKKLGYGLLVYDAYRPWSVTKMFWDATPVSMKKFVANPERGSRHNRGAAVDLTLYDLKTGKIVDMGGGFDEFTIRAMPDYPGGTSLQRWYRRLLRTAMEENGFSVYPEEWWHFDYATWEEYPIVNLPFEELGVKK